MSADVYHKSMTTKRFDIPLDHLEYDYIKSCQDIKELERILRVLRSGDEGHFPDLEKFCENQLTKLHPSSRVLRKDEPVLKPSDVNKNEWNDIETDLQDWTCEMQSQENIKKNLHGGSSGDGSNLPPVRGSNIIVNGTKETNGTNGVPEVKKKKVVPREYKDWDKIDIDKELEKVDADEPKTESTKKGKKASKPQNLKETVDTTGLSTADKLLKANREKDKGNEAFKSQDYEEALVYYSRSISLIPLPASYNNRALAYLKVSKWDDALQDCNSVLEIESDNIKALLRRGTAFKGKKEFTKSEKDFNTVLKLEPENKRAEELLSELKKEIHTEQKLKKEKGTRMVIEEVDGSDEEDPLPAESTKKTPMEECAKSNAAKSSASKAPTISPSSKKPELSESERFILEHTKPPKAKGKKIVIEEDSDSDDEVDLLDCISIRPEALQPPIEDTEEVYSPSKGKQKKRFKEVFENFKKDVAEKAEELVNSDHENESDNESEVTEHDDSSKTKDNISSNSTTPSVNSNQSENSDSLPQSNTVNSSNPDSNVHIPDSKLETDVCEKTESSCGGSSSSDLNNEAVESMESTTAVVNEDCSKSSSSDNTFTVNSESVFSRPVFKQLAMPGDVSVLREAGNDLFRKGQYGEAVTKYMAAIKQLEKVEEEQKVNLSLIYSNKAACELKIGDLPSAIKDCNKAIELIPHSVKPLLRRAAAYEGIERYTHAYADYKHVLCIDSSIEAAMHGLSRCQSALQQIHGSKWREKLPPITNVMPWEVPEIIDVTKPVDSVTKPSVPPAVPPTTQQPTVNTSHPDTNNSKVTVEKKDDKSSPPVNEDDTTPKEKPMTPNEKFEDLKSKGNTCVQKGEFRNAIEFYTECVELKPGKVVSYTNRALCFLRVDEPGMALVDCEAALLREPDNVKALFRRAQAKKMLKKYKDSLEDLTHLLKIDSKNTAAKKELEVVKNYWREELNAMKDKKSDEPEKKSESKTQKSEPKQRKKIIIEEDDGSDDNKAGADESFQGKWKKKPQTQMEEDKPEKKSKQKSKHSSSNENASTASAKSQQQGTRSTPTKVQSPRSTPPKTQSPRSTPPKSQPPRSTPPKSQPHSGRKTPDKTDHQASKPTPDKPQAQEAKASQPKSQSQETKKSKKGKSKQTKETSPGLPAATPSVPKLEKVTPYEFVQAWNSLKLVNDIDPYVKLMEQIPPEELPNMITNKLDGAMLNRIVQCTEKLIETGEYEKSNNILQNLCKVERFKTISMFMSGSDKDDVEEVLGKLSTKISDEDLSRLKKEFGIK